MSFLRSSLFLTFSMVLGVMVLAGGGLSCSSPVTADTGPVQGLSWVVHPRVSLIDGLSLRLAEMSTQQLGGISAPIKTTGRYETSTKRRTVGGIFFLDRNESGVVVSTKNGQSGWSVLVRPGGQLQLMHHNNCLNALSELDVLNVGEFNSFYWDYGTKRSTVYVNGMLLDLKQGKDGCDSINESPSVVSIGAFDNGSDPFPGRVHYIAKGDRLSSEDQSVFLEHLSNELSFLNKNFISIRSPQAGAVIQRQFDNTAQVNVHLRNVQDSVLTLNGKEFVVSGDDRTFRYPLEVDGPGRHVLEICASSVGCETVEYLIGDVFLLSGQSNALGSAQNVQVIEDESVRPLTGLYDPSRYGEYWKSIEDKSWVTHFCTRYTQYHRIPCGVVRFAVGSTGIHQWRPEAASGYLNTLRDALLESQGYESYPENTRLIKAGLWQHGETDSKRGDESSYYDEDLISIVDVFPGTRWYASNPQKLYLEGYTTKEKQMVIRGLIQQAICSHERLFAGPDFFQDEYDLSVSNKVHYVTVEETQLYGEAWVRLFM